MAVTRLIAMHQNKGKSISQCLGDRLDYGANPEKTNDGEFVSAYECNPEVAQGEFMLAKRKYDDITGRKQKNNVIAYQIRQSFKEGEVTPELANKIGYELAMRFTKGKHAFVVDTHTDKAHIHNHIYFNSTSIDCTKKFRDFLGSGKALARVSDLICLENGLSIIENPKKSKQHYGKWLGSKKPLNHSDKLRLAIDEALAKKPTTIDELLELLKQAGYEIKRGKNISFKSSEQKKFIRLKSLGEEYSEENLNAVISGKTEKPIVKRPMPPKKNVDLLIDIQQKLAEGKGGGYEYWAKINNAKQKAKTLLYLREHNLESYEELEEKANTASAIFDRLNTSIKADEKRLAEIKVLQTHIRNYRKTKDVYADYRKAGYSKKFYAEHETELIIHKSAKTAFNEIGAKKLPSLKALDEEYSTTLARKKKAYAEYKEVKKEMQDLLNVKQNVDRILNIEDEKKTKEKTQNER